MQSIELKAMSAAHALEQNGFDHTPVLEILQQRAELLEALKLLLEDADSTCETYDIAKAVITKAEAAE